MAQPYPRRSTRGAIVALVAAGFQLSMQPVEKMSITAQLAKSGVLSVRAKVSLSLSERLDSRRSPKSCEINFYRKLDLFALSRP